MATGTTGTVEFDIDDAYEAYIDSMEPGNMYAEAEAERERLAEEAWEAELDRANNEAYEASWNDIGI